MLSNDSHLRRLVRLIEIKEQASKLMMPYVSMIAKKDEKRALDATAEHEISPDRTDGEIFVSLSPVKSQPRTQMFSPVKLRRLLQRSPIPHKETEAAPAANRKNEQAQYSTISHIPRNLRFTRYRPERAPTSSYRSYNRSKFSESVQVRQHARRTFFVEPAIEFEVVEKCMRSTAIQIRRRKQTDSLQEVAPAAVAEPNFDPASSLKMVKSKQMSASKLPLDKKKPLIHSTKIRGSPTRCKAVRQAEPAEFQIDGWHNLDDHPTEEEEGDAL